MRRPQSYARRGPIREPYDYVLIVCEGGKTEPNYFNGLKRMCRLSSANIRVAPADGTDPMSIVRFAEGALQTENFDKAYCVFDRNGHANYNAALGAVAQSAFGRQGRLIAVPSVPCFEIWLLLHFAYSTAPFNAAGKESACGRVLRELKKHVPRYQKGDSGVFDECAYLIDQAITHATRLENYNAQSHSNNPATEVHKLVDYLRKLRR